MGPAVVGTFFQQYLFNVLHAAQNGRGVLKIDASLSGVAPSTRASPGRASWHLIRLSAGLVKSFVPAGPQTQAATPPIQGGDRGTAAHGMAPGTWMGFCTIAPRQGCTEVSARHQETKRAAQHKREYKESCSAENWRLLVCAELASRTSGVKGLNCYLCDQAMAGVRLGLAVLALLAITACVSGQGAATPCCPVIASQLLGM